MRDPGATGATGATGAVRIPERLVVLAPNWLGDAVMALPLIADLRRAWPDTEIAIAARKAIVPLFEMVPGITHTIALDGGGGVQALRAWRHNASLLAAARFDAALLLPNSFLAAWTTARAGIPERWGYARDLRRRLLTRVVPRAPKDAHQAAYYQHIGSALGLASGPLHAQVDVSGDDRRRADTLLAESGLEAGRAFVVMAPGAAYGRAKQWPPERFAELARLLGDRDLAVVLAGAKADAAVCREIATRIHAAGSAAPRVIDLAGRTDLLTFAAVLQRSRAVVANDSGAMHLAAAAGAQVIAVFGATNEHKTAPLAAAADAPRPRIVATHVWCRPCMLRECPIDHRCMRRIGAREVYDALVG